MFEATPFMLFRARCEGRLMAWSVIILLTGWRDALINIMQIHSVTLKQFEGELEAPFIYSDVLLNLPFASDDKGSGYFCLFLLGAKKEPFPLVTQTCQMLQSALVFYKCILQVLLVGISLRQLFKKQNKNQTKLKKKLKPYF